MRRWLALLGGLAIVGAVLTAASPTETSELAGQGYLNWLKHSATLEHGDKKEANTFLKIDASPKMDFGPMTAGTKILKQIVTGINKEKSVIKRLQKLMKNRMKGNQPESILVHVGQIGPPGARGNRGPRGKVGPPGVTGHRGNPGPRGDKGRYGPRGKTGPKGKPGKQGKPGRRGRQGPPGHRGEVGITGTMGAPGPRGRNGATGRPGRQGRNGHMGPEGGHGPHGLRGRPGSRGPRGIPGKILKPQLMRPRTFYKTRYGPADGRDVGFVNGRTLAFTKVTDASTVRFMYYDNLRAYSPHGNGNACRWEIRVNGRPCPSGGIGGDVYMWKPSNNHRPRVITGYCSRLPAGRHTMQIYVRSTPGYHTDCYTGWYTHQTSWTMEAVEVPNQPERSKLRHITGHGPADGRDVGFINGRTLWFTKTAGNSAIRLKYADNLRVYSSGAGGHACRWELKIDGRDCPSGRIGADAYIWGAHNNHRPRVIEGYCRNLPAGRHKLQAYVRPTPGYRGSDCYTGWYSQQTSWTLETEEVPAGSVDHTFLTSYHGPDGRDNGLVNGRVMRFTKRRGNSAIRLFYYDNLRVYAHGGGHACRWELLVDGRPCPNGRIGGDVYIWGARNNHRPRIITGYCTGLGAGTHTVTVKVGHTPGYGGDCYTGWYTNQESWTLEAKEV